MMVTVLDPKGPFIYTLRSQFSELEGLRFQASDAQQVAKWVTENNKRFKNWRTIGSVVQNGEGSDVWGGTVTVYHPNYQKPGTDPHTWGGSALCYKIERVNKPKKPLTLEQKVEAIIRALAGHGITIEV